MRRASSLILVTLIMAGIVVIVFGTHRLTLVQFNQSTRDEDKLFAYHGAKAAVEDGLIRYRHNPDVETNAGKVQRVDLSAGRDLGEVDDNQAIPTVPGYEPTNQYYDLKINFKVERIGDFGADSPTLAKDDSIELTGFTIPTAPDRAYYLNYRFEFLCPSGGLVQLQQIREEVSNVQTIYDQVTVRRADGQNFFDSALNGENLFIRNLGDDQLVNSVRLRAYECDVKYSFQTVDNINSTTPAGITFDGLTTYITATGYFAATKRTLIAEIDRQTGRLISIYDFNIYSGQGNITP